MSEALKLEHPCFAVKLLSGETLLTGAMYVQSGMMHFLYPIKINFTPMIFDDKIVTQYVPTLYQPFGNNKYIPIVAEHVISILKASEADTRFYNNSLHGLIIEETKRLLAFDRIMNRIDYADTYIMEAPTVIQ